MVRFASIPKCASRTLNTLGLLGEVPGKDHSRIKEYPEWDKYHWVVITRPRLEWYLSWWHEAKATNDIFVRALKLKFMSLEEDLLIIKNPPKDLRLPNLSGVHAWVPSTYVVDFPNSGLDWMDYCYSVIVEDVSHEKLNLSDLDKWLETNGYVPIHENVRGS